jgi:hypothetical protein
MRTALRLMARLALVVTVAAVVARIFRRTEGSRGVGEVLPSIGGDTWPPVPVNPDRRA